MDDEYGREPDEQESERSRDPQTDLARAALLERIQSSDRVYYVQQLEVLHERTFFHWITGRAVRELIDEERVRPFGRRFRRTCESGSSCGSPTGTGSARVNECSIW